MLKSFSKLSFLFLVAVQLSACFGYAIQTSSFATKNYRSYKKSAPAKGWEMLRVYEDEEPERPYEVLAEIVVTGSSGTTESSLLRKARKEAGRYEADALIFVEIREVFRSTFNGFAFAANLATAFSEDTCDDDYLEMGGEYDALELEARAIRFKKEAKE